MNTTPHPWPICEGLVVTSDESGRPHLAPMGPFVSPDLSALTLRPFQTSRTFSHLRRERRGVFHVTDDVELLAQAAVGDLRTPAEFERTADGGDWYLPSACRWLSFDVVEIDDAEPRSIMQARVTASGHLREFFGFNRAKHAVVEAAILATRIGLIDAEQIAEEFARLAPMVEKTGAAAEHRAFEFLRTYIANATRETTGSARPTPSAN